MTPRKPLNRGEAPTLDLAKDLDDLFSEQESKGEQKADEPELPQKKSTLFGTGPKRTKLSGSFTADDVKQLFQIAHPLSTERTLRVNISPKDGEKIKYFGTLLKIHFGFSPQSCATARLLESIIHFALDEVESKGSKAKFIKYLLRTHHTSD